MVEPKSKSDKEAGNLSVGVKKHLIDVYVQNIFGRKTDLHNKYITKGNRMENDSITLYNRYVNAISEDVIIHRKNEDRISNSFIMGTPDLYVGESIKKASHIIDVKSNWDAFTFFRTFGEELNNDYWWQLQCYMALTGATSATLAYCLVNTPDHLINDEKRKVAYRLNSFGETETPEYVEACKQIEKNMIYDMGQFKKDYPWFEYHTTDWDFDIPFIKRVHLITVDYDAKAIESLYSRIVKCREYLVDLDNKFNKPPL